MVELGVLHHITGLPVQEAVLLKGEIWWLNLHL